MTFVGFHRSSTRHAFAESAAESDRLVIRMSPVCASRVGHEKHLFSPRSGNGLGFPSDHSVCSEQPRFFLNSAAFLSFLKQPQSPAMCSVDRL